MVLAVRAMRCVANLQLLFVKKIQFPLNSKMGKFSGRLLVDTAVDGVTALLVEQDNYEQLY